LTKETKKKQAPWYWFTTFLILFSSITTGVFLWALGSNYNIFWSSGCALVVGGILFSLVFVFWFGMQDMSELI
jgi:membrane protein YdbS with pleckstrin-like domain